MINLYARTERKRMVVGAAGVELEYSQSQILFSQYLYKEYYIFSQYPSGNIPQKFKYSVKFEYFLFQYNGFYSPNIQVQNSSFWNKGKYFTFECWENIICMTGKNMEVGLWLYVSGILSFHILDMDCLDLKCLFLWQ